MGFDIPHGDPNGMREYARKLRIHADSVENLLGPLSQVTVPPPTEFRGRVAESFRSRREDLRRAGRLQRDRLYDLAAWLDARAADLDRQIEEARQRVRDTERRRQEMLYWGRRITRR